MNYDEAQKEFIGLIENLSGSYSPHQIFSDFCTMAAISLYQPFVKDEDLEKEYLSIIKQYNKKDADVFPKLFCCVIEGLEAKFGDFLGECYMSLGISNKHQGQFFTPYTISKFMAMILDVPDKEKIGVSDPACGAGGMIIAYAEMMKEQEINYQVKLEAQAVDIDKMCFHMTYIQLSLLGISAEVIWGNSLTLDAYRTWHTPRNCLFFGYRWGIEALKDIVSKEKDAVEDGAVSMNTNVYFQPTLFD